jgi:hypothetical protein
MVEHTKVTDLLELKRIKRTDLRLPMELEHILVQESKKLKEKSMRYYTKTDIIIKALYYYLQKENLL